MFIINKLLNIILSRPRNPPIRFLFLSQVYSSPSLTEWCLTYTRKVMEYSFFYSFNQCLLCIKYVPINVPPAGNAAIDKA